MFLKKKKKKKKKKKQTADYPFLFQSPSDYLFFSFSSLERCRALYSHAKVPRMAYVRARSRVIPGPHTALYPARGPCRSSPEQKIIQTIRSRSAARALSQ